jgi:hypothetical protein
MKTASGQSITLEPWWGTFELPLGAVRYFRIGPWALWVERRAREIRVSQKQYSDPLDTSLTVSQIVDNVADEPGISSERYAIEGRSVPIQIEPALADRPVVVRTDEPFHVLADDEATLYLTTPVWIRVSAGEQRKHLFERPCYRPSDTWFGRSTREGELCYAGVTTARLTLDELTLRPGRAVTQVRIVNQAATPLDLDRLNLPTPALSVFAAGDHRLWTEPVQITRDSAGEVQGVTIQKQLSQQARDAVRLTDPRNQDQDNLFSRAFKALLG